jgi:ABC-2 type transport system ATP-binding protein
MPELTNSVVVTNLAKSFGDFVAVDRINLAVRKGEVFGFLGPNGAGKSTTIRMLCGLLKPTSGRAEVAGFDVSRKPEAVRQNIGYMSQKFSLYNDLKVIENIRLFAGLYSVPSNKLADRIEWALTMANLKGQENLITGTLPGGWKQRLALGCAVLHKPPIIFLDEPTSGVDPITRRQFWELIHQMADEGVSYCLCNYALHGGGRILQPSGVDLPRQDCRAGNAFGVEAQFDEGRVASRRMRAAGRCGGSPAIGPRRDGCGGLWKRAAFGC